MSERRHDRQEVERLLAMIGALCEFAYLCGKEAGKLGVPRSMALEANVDPRCMLAWEGGWDDAMAEAAN